MSVIALRSSIRRIPCYYRSLILAAAALALLGVFWFASRYPQWLTKSQQVGQAVPSMAYSHELLVAAAEAPAWERILVGTVNWLDGMKIGMTFGVLFGALLIPISRFGTSGKTAVLSDSGADH